MGFRQIPSNRQLRGSIFLKCELSGEALIAAVQASQRRLPCSSESDDRPVWTAESGAVSALDAIQTASATGAKLANTEIR